MHRYFRPAHRSLLWFRRSCKQRSYNSSFVAG
ncbi:hypothetical protein TELCIR_21859 [Teladorsagia circumcincta]|uniref:Uncharacterized protein n=1 Tax=Teladorsagia circumcincta TaxID=45464 RepID=A0A2G9THB1_TELCI|nr:hypothetical protein TELCIR_21859 [Teladorsagia circumcincta]